MAKVYVFLAEGFEEVESLTAVDLLRRAEIEVIIVSIIGQLEVKGARGIIVRADELFDNIDVSDTSMLILPGGQPGTRNLCAYKPLMKLLMKWNTTGGKVAAICAAPMILGELGVLKGKKATCHPGYECSLHGAQIVEERVISDGNVTTSRGVGTAIPFALELITILSNKEIANKIKTAIVYED